MDILPSPGCPAKLYALLLKLRPLQYGTLMPFSGEADCTSLGKLVDWQGR